YVNFYGVDITEHRHAEEALKESEKRYRRFYEDAPLGYQSLDAEGCFLDVNSAWLELLGYRREEVIGRWFGDFHTCESLELFRERFPRFKAAGTVRNAECVLVCKDGSRIIVSIDGKISYDEHGDFKQTHCILHNVTEQKRAEEALRESEDKFKTLADEISDSIVIHDGERIIEVNKAFGKIWGCEPKEAVGAKIEEFITPESLKVVRERIRSGYNKPYEVVAIRKDGTRFPVEIAGKSITYKGKPARIATTRDITERKNMEEALRRNEARYRSSIELTGQLAWTTDSNGEVVEDIPLWRKFTGLSYEETKGSGWTKALHPEDAEHTRQVWGKAVKDKKAYEVEYRLRRFDGVYRDFLTRGIPVFKEDGSIREWVGVNIDITERKTTEKALRKSEQEKELILSNVAEMISYLDRELRIVWTNKAACNMADMSPREMIGRYCYEIWCHAERPCTGCPVKKALETGQSQEGEIRTDSKVWFMRGYPVLGDDGSILGVVETALDITERKMIEEALAKEHNLLRSLVDTLPDYIYVKDVNSRFVFGNTSVAAHLGVKSPEELSGKTDLDFFPKEMAQRFLKEEHEIIRSGKAIIDREQCSKIDRAHTVTKVPWRDDKGNIIGIIGINHDITERKQAEKKLLEYQEQLKSLASQVFLTAENERRRLAVGIHDQLGQQLAIIKLRLQSLMETVQDLEMLGSLKQTCSEVDQAIEDAHSLIFELSNPVLYELGLEAAVEQWLTEEIEEKHGIKCRFSADVGSIQLDSERRTILFQAFKELLVNVVKHARADVVEVDIRKKGEKICISVRDNGVGFVPLEKGMHPSTSKKNGFGLFSIREQIEYHGGTIKIESVPKQGTCVTICMPLNTNTVAGVFDYEDIN
ncbi:MAG: PAS domain S-box protein, partial [Deltaproteobacteria bacterium]|nr:PAS domain S-box protein [Deltaproteobacteria bacterium]